MFSVSMNISSDMSVPDYGSWCPAKTPILLAVFGYKGGSPAVWNFMSISLPIPLPGALKDDRWNDWRPGTEIQAQGGQRERGSGTDLLFTGLGDIGTMPVPTFVILAAGTSPQGFCCTATWHQKRVCAWNGGMLNTKNMNAYWKMPMFCGWKSRENAEDRR